MPTYQYLCRNCNHEFEELQSIKEEPLVHCPNCHTDNLVRVVGAGSGLIFKGSGFYLTDYKRDIGKEGRKKGSDTGQAEPKKETPSKASSSKPPSDSSRPPASSAGKE